MREIDRCERDVVFFADEAGSWQVGVEAAREAGTIEQLEALAEYEDDLRRRRR